MFTNKTLNNINPSRQFNQNIKNICHTNLPTQNKNPLLLNDPLSHIYETISVSSISNGNNQLNNQNRTIRNLYNHNSQFSVHPLAPHQQLSSNNQYIELESQIVKNSNHHHEQSQQHLQSHNNEMMFFGYDSTNEHSTSSSADYSSSQQSQDSYLKILPPSSSSNFTNNKSLISNFNLRNQNHLNNKLSFINVNNQLVSPAASSSQSLLTTANDFDGSMLNEFRQTNTSTNQNHFQRQQQQYQNRFNKVINNNNKNDYLQPDVNLNFLNIHQLNNSKNETNKSNGNQAVLFTNRVEAVV